MRCWRGIIVRSLRMGRLGRVRREFHRDEVMRMGGVAVWSMQGRKQEWERKHQYRVRDAEYPRKKRAAT